MTVSEPERKRLLYFADPMCSWCWGFSPVIARIRTTCDGLVPIRLCLGGLRAGETRPMSEKSKTYVRHHWEEVHKATGQRFDFSFFERDGFTYDTEPACRASVAMRNFTPDAALDYFAAVQSAFYERNLDVTSAAMLAEIAAPFGITAEDFGILFAADEIRESTVADFHLAQALGIGGFPTVVLQTGNRLDALTVGYRTYEELESDLQDWLET